LTAAAQHPEALMLYPNATDVRSGTLGGTDQLNYHVHAKFPATDVIGWVEQKLQKAAWEPLTYDFMNPDLHSPVRTWNELGTMKNPNECIRKWGGYWEDASANVVMYRFRYRDLDCCASDLADLQVTAAYIPATLAKQMQQRKIRVVPRKDRSAN
jgi:hypothetical protein